MRAWLARRDQRGLTFRELSAEVGVPHGTLAFWAWKLRQEGRPHPRRRPRAVDPFIELVATASPPAPPPPSPCLEVVVARGRRIVIRGPFDAEQLARVVEVLERC